MPGILLGLEGIDGCGKTTISNMLETKLIKRGINAKKITKKNIEYDNVNLTNFTSTFKKLIWDYEDDMLQCITSESWLYMHAIWYNILSANYIKPKLEEYDILIVDGWMYKMYSRFKLKPNFDMNLLDTVFNAVKKCDKVIMLDVPPEVCWNRRDNFIATELGGYDFEIDDPKNSYIRYQSMVRDELLKISKKEKWNVFNFNNESSHKVTDFLLEEVSNLVIN